MKKHSSKSIVSLASVGLLVGLVGFGGTPRSVATRSNTTLTVQLQANTGTASSKQNRVLMQQTQQWEKLHPGVSVKFLPNPYTTTTDSNAALVTEASAHRAPDLVWEQYGATSSGAIPQGILMNLMPYLNQPNPYVAGNKKWLSLWEPIAKAYMVTDGKADVLLGSDLATEIVYNKADFKKAGINATPRTFQQFVADLKKLKDDHFAPFMFTDATGGCNPSWYERKFMSELLHSEVSRFDVNHSQVADGLDTVVGIERGIISMKNPAYAEGWKLLGELRPYLAAGSTSYSACANVTATAAPLSQLIPFTQNKYAMVWSGTWHVPDLNSLGFSGKYGMFPFPTITTATTRYSANLNLTGVVGGPNGVGEWSVTTPAANSSMTPATKKLVINYLQYLYAPQNEGKWVADAGSGSFIPVIKGAEYQSAAGVTNLFSKKKPPVTIDGVLDGQLSASSQSQAIRLLQGYMSQSLSWSQFSSEWNAMLQQTATAWAQANHVNLAKYR